MSTLHKNESRCVPFDSNSNFMTPSKPAGRQQCLRSSSFDSDASSGILVKRNEENSWRKIGTRWRQEKVRADEEARGESFIINQSCAIERYYEITERVLEQFLESLQYSDRLEESYLSGNRLLKFLSSTLPTHRRFYSKDPLLTKLRIKSRNDLAQLGILVEEVAIKIDKNIYEDYLWGKVPDCEVDASSLHPLIFDDDHCNKRSSKKVTFSLQKQNGKATDYDDTTLQTDANISSSSSTSTTEFSECSLSSPESWHHQEALFSSSDQQWLINVAESNIERTNMAWNKGSVQHDGELFPANTNDFMLDSTYNAKSSSHIYWCGSSTMNEHETQDWSKTETSTIRDKRRKPVPNILDSASSAIVHERKYNQHTIDKKVHRRTEPSSRHKTVVQEGKRPVLNQSSTSDSCDEEEIDHADYVKKLTQLEFNHHDSPIRQIRLSKTLARRDAAKYPTCTVTRHEEDVATKQKSREKIENDLGINAKSKSASSLHGKDEDSSASSTTIMNSNYQSRSHVTSTSTPQSAKANAELADAYTDHLSESSFSEDDEYDFDDAAGAGIGIARRDECTFPNVVLQVEHLQYLKDRLQQDEPEAYECYWGKSWLEQLKRSTYDASVEELGGNDLSSQKSEKYLHMIESSCSDENFSSYTAARKDYTVMDSISNSRLNVLVGRENHVQTHNVDDYKDKCDLDAPVDELIQSSTYHCSRLSSRKYHKSEFM